MKILTRYILKETLTYFGVSLLVFTGLLLTGKVLRLTNLIVNRGVSFSEIGTVIVAIIPTFLEIAIPMAIWVMCCTVFFHLLLSE